MDNETRTFLEQKLAYHRSEVERLERWLAEDGEAQVDRSENTTNSEPHVNRQTKGELMEHHVVNKSVLDAAKEVLRRKGSSMSSYEITEALTKAGYDFGGKQAVKSVGKALRVDTKKTGTEVTYNAATGNYSLKTG